MAFFFLRVLLYYECFDLEGHTLESKRQRVAANREISRLYIDIMKGVNYFFCRKLVLIIITVVLASVALGMFLSKLSVVSLICGAVSSLLVGYLSMINTIIASRRVIVALPQAEPLVLASESAVVVGVAVPATSLGIIAALFFAYDLIDLSLGEVAQLSAFGLGASITSIYMRIGGGVFAKATDLCDDILQNSSEGEIVFPCKSNPSRTAKIVGDVVAVSGISADFFTSFSGAVITSLALGNQVIGREGLALALWSSAGSILTGIIGMIFCRLLVGYRRQSATLVFEGGILVAAILQVAVFIAVVEFLGIDWIFGVILCVGLLAGILVSVSFSLFISWPFQPGPAVANAASYSATSLVTVGLSLGMMTTALPLVIIAATIAVTRLLIGGNVAYNYYGVALASLGVSSSMGVNVMADMCAPVVNQAVKAAKVLEGRSMAYPPLSTHFKQPIGLNVTALGKGFSLGASVFSATALYLTFIAKSDIDEADMLFAGPGITLGAMIPYLFTALPLHSITRLGLVLVDAVQARKKHPQLNEHTDNLFLVRMASEGSNLSILLPATIVTTIPLIVGFGLGRASLAGILIGSISSGASLGVTLNAAGVVWAKLRHSSTTAKNTSATMDTLREVSRSLGDPLKDNAGPQLSLVFKVMCYVSLVFSPLLRDNQESWWVAIVLAIVLISLVPVPIFLEKTLLLRYSAAGSVSSEPTACSDGSDLSTLSYLLSQVERGDESKDDSLWDTENHSPVSYSM
jgi:K(+)-stimulated pyrophosphate-energized sodium pump